MRLGRRTATVPFSHHWCAGFGRLRVRKLTLVAAVANAPRAALTAFAWGVGGSPPPWQKGRPGVGACEVSSVFWFTMAVLRFKDGVITGERLSLAVRRASARYAGRSAPAARDTPGV